MKRVHCYLFRGFAGLRSRFLAAGREYKNVCGVSGSAMDPEFWVSREGSIWGHLTLVGRPSLIG